MRKYCWTGVLTFQHRKIFIDSLIIGTRSTKGELLTKLELERFPKQCLVIDLLKSDLNRFPILDDSREDLEP